MDKKTKKLLFEYLESALRSWQQNGRVELNKKMRLLQQQLQLPHYEIIMIAGGLLVDSLAKE